MTTNRLTAQDLNITQPEYDALIWVRDALDPSIPDHDLPAWMRFDMHNWGYLSHSTTLTHCGTACCIGGSMEMHIAGLTKTKQVNDTITGREACDFDTAFEKVTEGRGAGSKALYELFFTYPHDPDYTTRPKAVEAIDRFLAGNTEDPWLKSQD